MKGKRFSEEQIIAVLKESEAGAKTKELCRRHGISEATFYIYGLLPLCKSSSSMTVRTNAYVYSASAANHGSAPMGNPHARASTTGRPEWPI
jgi:putative transposase